MLRPTTVINAQNKLFRQQTRVCLSTFQPTKTEVLSTYPRISPHQTRSSPKPLVEHYRPTWPEPPLPPVPEKGEIDGLFPLAETREIPASVLRFQMQATFSNGNSIFYKHLSINPADYKVGLLVSEIFIKQIQI
jgi:hypothetical protein